MRTTEGAELVAQKITCPSCSRAIAPGEEWVACWACLTREHPDCWDAQGRCASCGHDRFLPASEAQRTASPLRRLVAKASRTARVPIVGALLFFAAPLVGLAWTIFGMIANFQKVATLKSPTPKDLSEGVYESLLGTTGGLAAGFVGLAIFAAWLVWYLRARVVPKAAGAAERSEPRTSAAAIASLGFGVSIIPLLFASEPLIQELKGLPKAPGILLGFGVLATIFVLPIVLGVRARRAIRASEGRLIGADLALAGILLPTAHVVYGVLACAIQLAVDPRAQSLGLAALSAPVPLTAALFVAPIWWRRRKPAETVLASSAAPRRSKLAIASLVAALGVYPVGLAAFGLASALFERSREAAGISIGAAELACLLFAIGAGIVALVRQRSSQGTLTGQGFAIAGLSVALGEVAIAVFFALVLNR
jgi:hypothetical protein